MVIPLVFSTLVSQALAADKAAINIYTEQFPPYNYQGDAGLEGFVVDVVQELKAQLGRDDKIRLVPWLRVLRHLDEAKPAMGFAMARTANREDQYQWVGPVASMNSVLVVRRDHPLQFTSLESARRLSAIAVLEHSAGGALLSAHKFSNVVAANRPEINFRMLLKGRVEAWLSVESSVLYHMHQLGINPDKFRLIDVDNHLPMYLVFSLATDPAEVARWQQALDQFKANGGQAKLRRQHQRYFSRQARRVRKS